jgi:hypothetical protein
MTKLAILREEMSIELQKYFEELKTAEKPDK